MFECYRSNDKLGAIGLNVNDWQPIINIAIGGLISLLTAWLTVKFALRRFQSEKWFERRVDAYTKVIEALHIMKQCTERQIRAVERNIEISSESETELISEFRRGLADLRRLADMGALIFSPQAIQVLDVLVDELNVPTSEISSWWHRLDSERTALSKALIELRTVAKKDLSAG